MEKLIFEICITEMNCLESWTLFCYIAWLTQRQRSVWYVSLLVVCACIRHGRGSIFCNPTQPNIEQQHNVVQIGYINQKI